MDFPSIITRKMIDVAYDKKCCRFDLWPHVYVFFKIASLCNS